MIIEDIEKYTGLVKSIAIKYSHYGVPVDDLIQEGMIGIVEASGRFNEDQNVKFSTYATYWIKKRILDALNKEGQIRFEAINEEAQIEGKVTIDERTELNLPNDIPLEEKEIIKMIFEQQLTLKEIAEKKGISREKVRQLKVKALRRLKSLNYSAKTHNTK